MAAAAGAWEEDEWELRNDDGFVYKRRKRRREEDTTASGAVGAPSVPPPDPEAQLRERRARKKKTLMKLRDEYQREIHQWERLSNTLREMEERSHHHQQQELSSSLVSQPPQVSESVCRPLVDELLLQAEAQEAIIQDLSNLCDAAEAMWKAEEERLKQALIDLPVWATPCGLLASLSDDSDQDYCNNNDDNT